MLERALRFEALEQREMLSHGINTSGGEYEIYAWTIINDMRDSPVQFAHELEGLRHRTLTEAHGVRSDDPIWADLRSELIGRGDQWDAAIRLLKSQPQLGPLAWEDELHDKADEHNDWMKSHCRAHSGVGKTCKNSLEAFGAPGRIEGEWHTIELSDRFDGNIRAENIGSHTGALSETLRVFGNDRDAYRQRLAYYSTIRFITEIFSNSLGHLKNLLSRDIGEANAIGLDFNFYDLDNDGLHESYLVTHEIASHANSSSGGYITGVVYADVNNNRHFDLGESVEYGIELCDENRELCLGSGVVTPGDWSFPSFTAFRGSGTHIFVISADDGDHVWLGEQTIEDGNEWLEFSLPGFRPFSGSVATPDRFEDNDNSSSATDLGAVDHSRSISGKHDALSIGNPDDEDWFRFELAGTTFDRDYIRIGFEHDNGDIDAELFRYDPESDELVRVSASIGVDDFEEFDLSNLRPGVYYLRVYGFDDATNFYTLDMEVNWAPFAAEVVGRTRTGDWWVTRDRGVGVVSERFGQWNEAASWRDVQIVDHNADGLPDVIGRTRDGAWWLAENIGGGFANEHIGTWNELADWRDVGAADIDGDGFPDIVGRASSGEWWVTFNGGPTVSFGQWAESARWSDVHLADFTGDGLPDVLGRASTGDWWLGRNVETHFHSEFFGQWSNAPDWRDVLAADFTGDGLPDVLGRTETGDWWLGRNDGEELHNEFVDLWNESALWRDVQVFNFNGDRFADVVGRTVAGDWWITVFHESGSSTGWIGRWNEAAEWQNVVAGDFNGDGRVDILGRASWGDWWLGANNGVELENEFFAPWSAESDWRDVAVLQESAAADTNDEIALDQLALALAMEQARKDERAADTSVGARDKARDSVFAQLL